VVSLKRASALPRSFGFGGIFPGHVVILKRMSGLNPPQAEAVNTLSGPMLVLAGAGTGKTRVITFRIAKLIKSGIPGGRILGMTFTNKAANEMKERLEQMLGAAGGKQSNKYQNVCPDPTATNR